MRLKSDRLHKEIKAISSQAKPGPGGLPSEVGPADAGEVEREAGPEGGGRRVISGRGLVGRDAPGDRQGRAGGQPARQSKTSPTDARIASLELFPDVLILPH